MGMCSRYGKGKLTCETTITRFKSPNPNHQIEQSNNCYDKGPHVSMALFPQGKQAVHARCNPGERKLFEVLKRHLPDDQGSSGSGLSSQGLTLGYFSRVLGR